MSVGETPEKISEEVDPKGPRATVRRTPLTCESLRVIGVPTSAGLDALAWLCLGFLTETYPRGAFEGTRLLLTSSKPY